MKNPWNFSKFKLLMYFQFYKAANFYKIPQEIWLTLSRFTGRQEKKDALEKALKSLMYHNVLKAGFTPPGKFTFRKSTPRIMSPFINDQ